MWAPGPAWSGAENLAPPGFEPSRYTNWAIPVQNYIAYVGHCVKLEKKMFGGGNTPAIYFVLTSQTHIMIF